MCNFLFYSQTLSTWLITVPDRDNHIVSSISCYLPAEKILHIHLHRSIHFKTLHSLSWIILNTFFLFVSIFGTTLQYIRSIQISSHLPDWLYRVYENVIQLINLIIHFIQDTAMNLTIVVGVAVDVCTHAFSLSKWLANFGSKFKSKSIIRNIEFCRLTI